MTGGCSFVQTITGTVEYVMNEQKKFQSESICIGDIRRSAESLWKTDGRRPSFLRAIKHAFAEPSLLHAADSAAGEPSLLHAADSAAAPPSSGRPEYAEPDDFMSPEELSAYIDRIPLRPLIVGQSEKLPDEPAENLIIPESSFPAGKDVVTHIHIPFINDGYHTHEHFELNYVYSGEACLHFNYEVITLKEGTFLILPPNIPHNVMSAGNSLVITVEVRKSTFTRTFPLILQQEGKLTDYLISCIYHFSRPEYLRCEIGTSHLILNLFQTLIRESAKEDSFQNIVSVSIVTQIFAEVTRRYDSKITFLDGTSRTAGKTDFLPVLHHIWQNYRDVSLEDLSSRFHYNPTYISTRIREITGMTFSDILTDIRLKKAAEMLQYTDSSILEISERIGYHSADHFSRIFKKTYHDSPSHYREKYQSGTILKN